jgi:hypothetical protein
MVLGALPGSLMGLLLRLNCSEQLSRIRVAMRAGGWGLSLSGDSGMPVARRANTDVLLRHE